MCPGIQEWTSKICGTQPLKTLKLPILGPFLNTFNHMELFQSSTIFKQRSNHEGSSNYNFCM